MCIEWEVSGYSQVNLPGLICQLRILLTEAGLKKSMNNSMKQPLQILGRIMKMTMSQWNMNRIWWEILSLLHVKNWMAKNSMVLLTSVKQKSRSLRMDLDYIPDYLTEWKFNKCPVVSYKLNSEINVASRIK